MSLALHRERPRGTVMSSLPAVKSEERRVTEQAKAEHLSREKANEAERSARDEEETQRRIAEHPRTPAAAPGTEDRRTFSPRNEPRRITCEGQDQRSRSYQFNTPGYIYSHMPGGATSPDYYNMPGRLLNFDDNEGHDMRRQPRHLPLSHNPASHAGYTDNPTRAASHAQSNNRHLPHTGEDVPLDGDSSYIPSHKDTDAAERDEVFKAEVLKRLDSYAAWKDQWMGHMSRLGTWAEQTARKFLDVQLERLALERSVFEYERQVDEEERQRRRESQRVAEEERRRRRRWEDEAWGWRKEREEQMRQWSKMGAVQKARALLFGM